MYTVKITDLASLLKILPRCLCEGPNLDLLITMQSQQCAVI